MYDWDSLGKKGRGTMCDGLRRMTGKAYMVEGMSHPEKPKGMVLDTFLPSVGWMDDRRHGG